MARHKLPGVRQPATHRLAADEEQWREEGPPDGGGREIKG